MFFNIIDAVYMDGYRINLIFKNGKSGTVDLGDYISDGEIFQDIRSVDEFKKFAVDFGTLTWNDSSIDIAPETLYEKATGETLSFDSHSQKVG